MIGFTFLFAAAVSAALAAPSPSNIFEIDLSPEEAQKYLNSPPFTDPQLSGRTGVLPLVRWNDPRFRTAEAGPTLGHYWKNGREIENTEDYVEEVYDAQQFHGQDGLGAYAYGYQAPESAKVENRAQSGDVVGSYTYKDGNNQLIKVRYWADSEGFHQEDNIPKAELQPAQETEEVRQARLAHEKAWQEAADAAAQNPDPQGEYTPENYGHEYQGSASEPQGAVAVAQQYDQHLASPAREGKAYFAQSQSSYQSNQQQAYPQQRQQNYPAPQQAQKSEEVETTGPPKGFFYSYTYPVSIIQAKNGGQQGGFVNPGQPLDQDTVQVNNYRQG